MLGVDERSFRIAWTVFLLAAPAAPRVAAHMISMSSGDLRLRGDRAEYELRMPLYETTHMKEPEKALFQNIHFYDGNREATLVKHLCEPSAAQDAYLCRAEYQFPGPVKNLEAQCTFAAVTVPNHVHLLRAERAGVFDQAIFDYSYTRFPLRFPPPGRAAMTLSQVWAGMRRAAGGPAQLLFLVALAMAARRRRELYALAGSFLAAECASALWVGYGSWSPAPRFVEAAAALTVAYLAVEILLLPEAGHRWAVAGALGVFHGFYFGLFLRDSQMHPLPVLAGVLAVEVALLALFAWLLALLKRGAAVLRPVQAGAGALLLVGMAWFFLRLRN
ncbi:MAG: HupE/UreJ family protein [Acidobacteria bacterium]|nr:HupE/UreJ family protein [Acidobacteriota bacterium]